MGQSPSSPTCEASPTNAKWNNYSDPNLPPQSEYGENPGLLNAFLAYAVVGGISSILNISCILVFLTKKEHREKYLFYALLAFGNLCNTFFMFIAGVMRRHMIYTNGFQQVRSSFECLLQPAPHLQVFGGQLPSIVILVINIERFVAVYRPMLYKKHISHPLRVRIAIGCIVTALISLSVGYVCAYFSTYCSNYFCSVTSVYRFAYSNYNTAMLILFPVSALTLNILTYIGAKSRLVHVASMKKELKHIFFAMAITSVDVVMISFPNFIVYGAFMQFITSMTQTQIAYFYVLFCCNSVSDLFVYTILKRDFRNHLLNSISFGALKPYLKNKKAAPNQRIVDVRQAVPSDNTHSARD